MRALSKIRVFAVLTASAGAALIAGCSSGDDKVDSNRAPVDGNPVDGGANLPTCGEGGTTAEAGMSTDGSASAGDAGTDGAVSSDGGSSAVMCGGKQCYTGQSCVGGACAFGCTGTHVPGDYATVQSAVSALQGVGGTICLTAATYEDVNIWYPLTLQGISPAQSILSSISISSNDVTIKGLGVGALSIASSATVIDCKVSTRNHNSSPYSAGILISAGGSVSLDVSLDGLDVSDTNGTAISITPEQTTPSATVKVKVQNSYIHDSGSGLAFGPNTNPSSSAAQYLTIVNNTFANNAVALVQAWYSGGTASFYNNIFYKNNVAVNLDVKGDAFFGSNALFDNTTNYMGFVVDGPGYVKSDLLLDMSVTPPGLLAGSPCIGAADPQYAPAQDFWGNPRSSRPDIGAVQSVP
jgi:hypothetical protein